MKRFLGLFLAAVMVFLSLGTEASALSAGGIEIEPVAFNNPDFIKGMDVSSVISLEEAGVRFFDEDGREKDLFLILSENGVNFVRVRIWNDPYTAEGNPYGGGNCDVHTACLIAKRCSKYGLRLLLDFHYSDFWADPGRQKAPKAWAEMTLDEKTRALHDYTLSVLEEVKAAGGDIGMVQIGNETTSGIAGEYDFSSMARLWEAGAKAVRSFDENIPVALHFTDPEKTETMKWYADMLDAYRVDYDVFAVSYYPYWHGSLENLTQVLSYAAAAYDKYALVAETSYAYTLSDSDGHPNTVSEWNNSTGEDLLWDFTAQGQAQALRDVMNAVNTVPDGKGLGVFYWEGAWISVGDVTGLSGDAYERQKAENQALWERFGCGWAASYSSEYDDGAGAGFYGGSAVDNQAFFSPQGKALPSLKAFLLVSGYRTSFLLGDADTDGSVTVLDATSIQRYLASLSSLSETGMLAADVEENGSITVLCATYIQKYLASLAQPYPIDRRRFI